MSCFKSEKQLVVQKFFKTGVLKIPQISQEKSVLKSLFNKVAGLEKSKKRLQKRLQHRCFPVKFANFLKTPFSKENLSTFLVAASEIKSLLCSAFCYD